MSEKNKKEKEAVRVRDKILMMMMTQVLRGHAAISYCLKIKSDQKWKS